MSKNDWKNRLIAAINAKVPPPIKRRKKDADSYLQLSLAAGLSRNFVSQFLKDEKMPSVENFISLCQALNVSPIYILLGLELTPAVENLLVAWSKIPPAEQEALSLLFERRTSPLDDKPQQ